MSDSAKKGGGDTVLRITGIISASAAISLVVSLLTGSMNIGGYIKQLGQNTTQIETLSAQVQVLILAQSQEKILVEALGKTLDRWLSDKDQAAAADRVIAERLATLDAQMKSGLRQLSDIQTEVARLNTRLNNGGRP